MNTTRRKFLCETIIAVAASSCATYAAAADYSAVISCTHCGTGFRVTWNGTAYGYGSRQCPNCHKESRVHFSPNGVEKVERVG